MRIALGFPSPLIARVLVTEYVNAADAVWPWASVTVMVSVLVPVWLAAGVRVKVRSAPLPPKVMLALGRSVVFEEIAFMASEPAAVSASQMPNHSGPVAVFIDALTLGMAVICGPRF